MFFFFFNDPATTEIYTLSLHDALPIYGIRRQAPVPGARRHAALRPGKAGGGQGDSRSEEHTSELQSQSNLVCRLLLEKKNNDTPGCLSIHALHERASYHYYTTLSPSQI